VSAVSSLTTIYRLDGSGDLLRQTLQLAIDAWGGKAENFAGDVLRGLAGVLQRYALTLDVPALRKRLSQLPGGAAGLLGRGRTFRSAMGGPIGVNISRAIVAIYNAGRRSQSLADWDTRAEKAEEAA